MSWPDSNIIQESFEVAESAARKAREIVLAARESEGFQVDFKDPLNLVTSADIEADGVIVSAIKDAFPEHSILSEETSSDPDFPLNEGPLWIIDPIDGTTNFAHGHVHVGISIAFALDGEVRVGIVDAPFLGKTYSAVQGQGARCNKLPIQVSKTTSLEEALICTGFPYDRTQLTGLMERLYAILKRSRDVRRFGAASIDICLIAEGKLDGFYEDLAPWDVAAGMLIAREAGASIGRFDDPTLDRPYWSGRRELPESINGKNVVLSCPGIFEEFISALSPEGMELGADLRNAAPDSSR